MLIAQVSVAPSYGFVRQIDLWKNAKHRILAPDNHQIPGKSNRLPAGGNQQARLLLGRRWSLFVKTFLLFYPEASWLLFLFLLTGLLMALFEIVQFRKRSLHVLLQLLDGVDEFARRTIAVRWQLRHC